MSSFICNTCDWHKNNYCTNNDSEFFDTRTKSTNTCGNYYPALSITNAPLVNIETSVMTKETVNHPNHYNIGGIEVIDFIESWDLNFSLGNAIKYIARAPYKNDKIEDLKKARWYIDREIQRLEKDTK